MSNKEKRSIVESLTEPDDTEEPKSEVNTLQDSLKELGNQLFIKNSEKTSNLSHDNINGLIRADALNDYMETNFGYRYAALDTLMVMKPARSLSYNGFGVEKLIEIVKSIQASFEQTQLPATLRDRLMR